MQVLSLKLHNQLTFVMLQLIDETGLLEMRGIKKAA